MGGWAQLADPSWQKFEGIFNVQPKTPPLQEAIVWTPQAPRKVNRQFRREGLKPRKLTYEPEPPEQLGKMQPDKPDKAWEDSGVALWANTSAQLRAEDADKENRQESDDIILNSQKDIVEPGSLRDRLNQRIARTLFTIYFE